jgi:uncharacterized protein with HEPN domain
MSRREAKLLLTDILEAISKIELYINGYTFDQFMDDSKTKDAVIRNFEIIGEAANRIPDDIKMKYPQVNWQRLRGFRNRIVHDYIGIDYEIVWNVIQLDLDILKIEIEAII